MVSGYGRKIMIIVVVLIMLQKIMSVFFNVDAKTDTSQLMQ